MHLCTYVHARTGLPMNTSLYIRPRSYADAYARYIYMYICIYICIYVMGACIYTRGVHICGKHVTYVMCMHIYIYIYASVYVNRVHRRVCICVHVCVLRSRATRLRVIIRCRRLGFHQL